MFYWFRPNKNFRSSGWSSKRRKKNCWVCLLTAKQFDCIYDIV